MSSKGFSIVELMVVMALGGVAFLGLGSLVNLSSKFDRSSVMNAENLELASIVRQLVNNPKACTPNLQGSVLHTATRAPTAVDLAFMKSTSNPDVLLKSNPVLKTSPSGAKSFGKIAVNSVSLIPDAELTTDTWLIKVRIDTRKTGQAMGSPTSVMDIPARVKIDPLTKTIVNCSANSDSSVLTEDNPLNDKICKLVTGGVATYDPALNKCIGYPVPPPPQSQPSLPAETNIVKLGDLTETVCRENSGGAMGLDPETGFCNYIKVQVKGSLTSCQCPAGYRLSNCKGAGPYFDSKSGKNCIDLEDGSKHCAGVQECKQDKVNMSGTCSYDKSSGANFKDAYCRCDCWSG